MSYSTAPPLIPLDSPADLPRIRASFHTLLATTLATKLEHTSDPDLARQIRNELEDWEEAMFSQSAPNLKLNGLPYSTYLDDPSLTEDFDETLDRHIRSLAAEKELIQVQLAERRATTPGLVRGLMDDLEQRRRAGERVPEEEDGDGESMQVDDKLQLTNAPALKETFTQTLDHLAHLQAILPAQVQRAEQAKSVVDQVGRLPA